MSGYEFYQEVGSAWIKDVIPATIDKFSRLAQANKVAVILGSPRFSEKTKKYHNAAIFIRVYAQLKNE
jgi:hypothetical protein